MNVTFLGHSGFFVETETCCLLFDYYTGDLPAVPTEKPLYIFSSHSHYDHFSEKIFTLAEGIPQVWFILSDDIFQYRVPKEYLERTTFVAPRKEYRVDALGIETLRSTDAGVAFLVTVEGKTLYHAGDLNCWVWEQASAGENSAMEAVYTAEMECLREKSIFAAFVPLDPRLGAFYDRGMLGFLAVSEAPHIFPIHMWGDPAPIKTFQETYPKYKDRIIPVEAPGQVFGI